MFADRSPGLEATAHSQAVLSEGIAFVAVDPGCAPLEAAIAARESETVRRHLFFRFSDNYKSRLISHWNWSGVIRMLRIPVWVFGLSPVDSWGR